MSYPIIHEKQRRKIRNPLAKEFVETILAEKVYIVNVSDVQSFHNRTYGTYIVEAADPARGYSVLEITGRRELMDEGDEKYAEHTTRAQDIAEDIVKEANEGIMTLDGKASFIGKFICDKPVPSTKQLQEAKAKLMAFYADQVAMADRFWDDPHEHKNIHNLHRRAGKALGLKKPWIYDAVQQFVNCPACGESILSTVAVCKTCGAVINEEQARKFFPDRFTDAPAAEAGGAAPPRKPRATKQPEA